MPKLTPQLSERIPFLFSRVLNARHLYDIVMPATSVKKTLIFFLEKQQTLLKKFILDRFYYSAVQRLQHSLGTNMGNWSGRPEMKGSSVKGRPRFPRSTVLYPPSCRHRPCSLAPRTGSRINSRFVLRFVTIPSHRGGTSLGSARSQAQARGVLDRFEKLQDRRLGSTFRKKPKNLQIFRKY